MGGSQHTSPNESTSGGSYGTSRGVAACADLTLPENFPVGLRVLVVDQDVNSLRNIESTLRRYRYNVTACFEGMVALNLLREKRGCFDMVLMDEFTFFENLPEIDIPFIMMSSNGETSAVMRAIKYGACNFFIKPIREEELKIMWQHVFRIKKDGDRAGNKELVHLGLEGNDQHKQRNTDVENPTEEALKPQKKRIKEGDGQQEDDPSTTSRRPKPRVVWTLELHQQFVNAVHQLGLDKAVPKRILELMNVAGLTRENVASHLQKFRLYMKRTNGGAQQQGGISNTRCGSFNSNVKPTQLGRFEIQALAAAGHISPHRLALLRAEHASRQAAMGQQQALLQSSLPSPKYISSGHGSAFVQPLGQCQANFSKNFGHNMASIEETARDYNARSSNGIATLGPSSYHVNRPMDMLQQQQHVNRSMDMLQQQQQHRQFKQPQEHNQAITVQQSCVPSPTSVYFQTGNISAPVNQNSSYNRIVSIDDNFLSPMSNSSSINTCQLPDDDFKAPGYVSAYSAPCPPSPVSSYPVDADSSAFLQVQNPTMPVGAPNNYGIQGSYGNNYGIQGSYGTKSGDVLDQVPHTNLGYNSQFTADQFETQFGEGNADSRNAE